MDGTFFQATSQQDCIALNRGIGVVENEASSLLANHLAGRVTVANLFSRDVAYGYSAASVLIFPSRISANYIAYKGASILFGRFASETRNYRYQHGNSQRSHVELGSAKKGHIH